MGVLAHSPDVTIACEDKNCSIKVPINDADKIHILDNDNMETYPNSDESTADIPEAPHVINKHVDKSKSPGIADRKSHHVPIPKDNIGAEKVKLEADQDELVADKVHVAHVLENDAKVHVHVVLTLVMFHVQVAMGVLAHSPDITMACEDKNCSCILRKG